MRYRGVASWVLFVAGLALLVYGFAAYRAWHDIAWKPTHFLLKSAAIVGALGFVLKKLCRCQWATGMALVWCAALIAYVGVWPSLSMLVIAACCMALGSLVVTSDWEARAGVASLVGLGLMCGAMGWLLPLPIHRQLVYLALCLAIIYLRRHVLREWIGVLPAAWKRSVADAPAMAGVAVMAIGIVSMSAWVPTIGYDDLAYHLALPSQLQLYGFYRMDPAINVWAVSAWLGDVLHAVIQVMSGTEGRGAVMMYWLIVASTSIWILCRAMGLSPALRWLAVALYASLPMTSTTVASMQTEGATAALVVTAALVIQIYGTDFRRARVLLVLGCLFGCLIGLKVINILFIAPLVVWLLCRWREHLPWRGLIGAAGASVVIGGSSYIYAYALTGNPVLPIFNGVFRSTYFDPTNFHDARWETGIPWNVLMRVVFHTSTYTESGDGTGGFPLVALAGCMVMALVRRESRVLALLGASMFMLPFGQLQYLRYAYPAVALLIPAMLCGLPRGGDARSGGLKIIVTSLLALIVADFLFVSSGGWMQSGDVVRMAAKFSQQDIFKQFAPTRQLARIVARRYGDGARTLIISKTYPFAAEFPGRAYVTTWYDLKTMRRAESASQDTTGAAWLTLWDELGINVLILEDSDLKPAIREAIRTRDGVLEATFGGLQLWRVGSRPVAATDATFPGRFRERSVFGIALLQRPFHHLARECIVGAAKGGHYLGYGFAAHRFGHFEAASGDDAHAIGVD